MNSLTKLESPKLTRRPWSTNEDELLTEMLLHEVDYDKAAKVLDRTVSSINNRAIKLGVSKTQLNLPRASRAKKKNNKQQVTAKKVVKSNAISSKLLKLKVRNYRILVGVLAFAQASTLTAFFM